MMRPSNLKYRIRYEIASVRIWVTRFGSDGMAPPSRIASSVLWLMKSNTHGTRGYSRSKVQPMSNQRKSVSLQLR